MKKIIIFIIVLIVLMFALILVVIQQVKNKTYPPNTLKGYWEYAQTESAKDAIRQFYAKPVTFPQPNDSSIYNINYLGDAHYLITGVVIDPNDVKKSWEVVRALNTTQDDYIIVYIKIGNDVKLDIR